MVQYAAFACSFSWQGSTIGYVRMPTFIGVLMILDMLTSTRRPILFSLIFQSFQIFSGSDNFILFKNFLVSIYFFVLGEADSLQFTFVLKKPYFLIFHTNY